jgi:NAD+ diphosphatase
MARLTNKFLIGGDDYLIVVNQQQLYVGSHSVWQLRKTDDLASLLSEETVFLPLGEVAGSACYVAELSRDIVATSFVNLRSQLPLLSAHDYRLASRALQLITWYQQHQFCGQCGHKTMAHADDLALFCERCALSFYPRIAPCMMCLIVRGDECLLAHHHRQSEGMYSTLAGFVEAGETVEQTIHREVMEEVGLQVSNLRYFASQSWPFPHQLMLGFFVDYEAGDIVLDDAEITDARWFSYDNLPTIPPPTTLSGQLIQAFVQQRTKA